ncbi:antitoxin Xre/MbcA/ParS toxin-binding domain-containing protein [Pseudomonas rubra]|uniref:MbcA/ParS/Xre antitoxin family protein n=1 Tax=Pseudomonas rubra TaxID=2942627 RepID=A0ABT5PE36_9PSED|nr:antitoxin Xre/MbcA/ParS toxin-binding domain-containing protein [Pseudomonas rubra]MDD1016523.1 MbcA/ParS/Xre antitoxin family protein [Pseudomonas rubra]MDD1038525.1 MbcA/ParS/Xre antitoxin family protein [Pseudomonas rubra]MDD1156074.1 MbcA/ParS/Xre antitoxin family protein [Pseudomonas rubra]
MRRASDQRPALAALAGSPKDVRKRQSRQQAEQVVAVALADASPGEVDAIAATFASVAGFVKSLMGRQQQQALESIVEALVPKAPPTPNALKEAAMLAQARTAVLQSGDWLTAAQIAGLAGFSPSNPSAQPNKWKREGAIFALRHHGVDYFPAYGLDAGYRPLKAMAPVLARFAEAKDSWGLGYWFMSANSFLGGKRPLDLLGSAPEQVLAAAEDELQGIAHG